MKIANNLKRFRYFIRIIFQMAAFRIKVFLHKMINK